MKKEEIKKKAEKKTVALPSKKEWLNKFFGKFKEFGDGLEYQHKMRHGNG